MGWTYCRKAHDSAQAFLDSQFTWQGERDRLRVLKSSMYGRGEYYAAVEAIRDSESPRVFAVVCAVDQRGDEIGWKDMDESMNPYFYNCPAVILDLLSPLSNAESLASKWREKCRATIAAKAPPAQIAVAPTFEISFAPAFESDGFHSIMLSMLCGETLLPRVKVAASTLSECKAAFDSAIEAAKRVAADAIRNASPQQRGEPRVYVSAHWRSKGRKPNGFNAVKWQAYVEPQSVGAV